MGVLGCTEMSVDDYTVGRFWVKFQGQANKEDVTVGVYYGPPNRDDTTNEFFFSELKQISL